VIGLVGRHSVAIGKLPMDFGVEVGEGGAEDFVQLSGAGLVGRAARLRCVIDEVVGKQFIEHREIAAPCTSSVLRRTIAFAVSLALLLVMTCSDMA
jgi:hypothetical protein